MRRRVKASHYTRPTRDVPRHWSPLIKSDGGKIPQEMVEAIARDNAVSLEEARRILDEDSAKCEYWVNHLYQVEVRRVADKLVQLNIRRRDGASDVRDWRHFQQIKNELVGPEVEGVELYPAESRKVDTSNKWHIWCVTDPTFRFPFGWEERDVSYEGGEARGMRQRPL